MYSRFTSALDTNSKLDRRKCGCRVEAVSCVQLNEFKQSLTHCDWTNTTCTLPKWHESTPDQSISTCFRQTAIETIGNNRLQAFETGFILADGKDQFSCPS